MEDKETPIHLSLQKMEEELHFLKKMKRREIAERIKTAISNGDLSENSEYESAKTEQAFLERRIDTLERMLHNARLRMNEVKLAGISLGTRVKVRDLELDHVVEYTIVSAAEADPPDRKISSESPVGRALLGQGTGTKVNVQVPTGVIRYEVLEIMN
ncbi:transcription elongation factor GreA [Collibacillus ludicampi]|uniref:Transcription elongation factor GreA n=1 Tax=Collibacillus ludicampi TaxID=2771369 RepID=A0AAV4LEI1_9BACL|nr:transcription elongation factor GreA [Collibacillus ludicampi]GIM46083.1 transcription elongation factor GreA [Collibacillus ludicampi]